MNKAEGVVWDLSFLYDSIDDPRIIDDLDKGKVLAEKFVADFRGRIKSDDITTGDLLKAISDMENVYVCASKPYHFASLKFSEDTQNQKHLALLAMVRDRFTHIRNLLVFFDVELMEMSDETAGRIISDPAFEHFKFWLMEARKSKPYTLTEKEEQVINLKDTTGKSALVQFYQEYTGDFKFELEVDGEVKTLTGEEISSFFLHPDRELRKKAYDSFFRVFKANDKQISFILGTLVKDHANEGKLRKYPDAMTTAYLRDQVDKDTIDNLMAVVEENYSLVQRYYKLKAIMLGLEKLKGWDRSAPVGKDYSFKWDEARNMVEDAYSAFDPEVGGFISEFFTKNWIDAEIRTGKRGGAFCSGTLPHLNPVVLMNFTDKLNDVYTLAHELGHGLHDIFAAQKQGLTTYHPPLCVAETASIFGEMLLTDKLLKEATSNDMKRDIICRQLEGIFNTCSRQIMYIAFERKIHAEGAKRRLTPDEISNLWEVEESRMYGDSIELHPMQKLYWARIGHFIFARFYCFAYAFGKLFVLALYQRYLQDPEAFIPAYKEMLRAGGQIPPHLLASKLGMDITAGEFWKEGFKYAEGLLDELEKLV